VTNLVDITPAEVLQRYRASADIERDFRVLKSEIEIAPVFHRLPECIRANAGICFMALILYRVMRQRLKRAGHQASPCPRCCNQCSTPDAQKSGWPPSQSG
jgi:transposase